MSIRNATRMILTLSLFAFYTAACEGAEQQEMLSTEYNSVDTNVTDTEQAALKAQMGEDGAEVDGLLAEEKKGEPIDKKALLKHKTLWVMVAWGQLKHPKNGPLTEAEVMPEAEASAPTETLPPTGILPPNPDQPGTAWNGFVETNAKKLTLLRTLRFEGKDHIVPCVDGQCVGFETKTWGGVDGILVRIDHLAPTAKAVAMAKTNGAEKPETLKTFRLAISNENGAEIDVEIPLHKLAGFHKIQTVDSLGNQVAIRATAKRPLPCPHGKLRGKVKGQDGKGTFHGKWKNANGEATGHVAGVFHKTGPKAGKWTGAYTDADGNLMGALKGRFHAMPTPDGMTGMARFVGRAFNAQGDVIGFVRGKWFRSANGKSGFMGRWRANCHVDRPCDPCKDLDKCADQTDDDGLAKPAPKPGMCIDTEIIAACSHQSCELIDPEQKVAHLPFAGKTALFTYTDVFPESSTLTVQHSEIVYDATDIISTKTKPAKDGFLVATFFNTLDLPWDGQFKAKYTVSMSPMPIVPEGAKLADSIGAATASPALDNTAAGGGLE